MLPNDPKKRFSPSYHILSYNFFSPGKQQRAQLYLGAFDYSGEVQRDPESAHFLADGGFDADVFPPYARGAGLVMSIDLVRKM